MSWFSGLCDALRSLCRGRISDDGPAYRVGEREERPWGSYLVTDVGRTLGGDEFCEKLITIRPGGVLSLQSHRLRDERWTVEKGALTAIVDDNFIIASAGHAQPSGQSNG